jgi:transaldolase
MRKGYREMLSRSGYFHRVARETPTRLWINNPTGEDARKAIEAGAINCTTNPAYCSKLLDGEPDYVRALAAQVVRAEPDDDAAGERVYQLAAQRIMDTFLPLYKASSGTQGFVTIQGDPRRDDDPDQIVGEALRQSRLGPNFMAKIPVTVAGSQAIAELVSRDIPLCATEVFAVDQAVCICEAYEREARRSGKRPPFFVTHITGIFDEYVGLLVKREGLDITPAALYHAGCIVARKEYQVLKERSLPGTLLGGGARGNQHFTEFVGGDFHITINWSTAKDLIDLDGPVVPRIDAPAPPEVVDELTEKLPDFRKAYYEGGLPPEEFKDFGPLQHFRNSFIEGYDALLDAVRAAR